MGGGDVSTHAGILGVPAPRLSSKRKPLVCVTRTTPRPPGRNCPGTFSGRGGATGLSWEPRGTTARALRAAPTPGLGDPPAASGPCSPARPYGGRARGKPTHRGVSSAPASCSDPSGFLLPQRQWEGGGKKG